MTIKAVSMHSGLLMALAPQPGGVVGVLPVCGVLGTTVAEPFSRELLADREAEGTTGTGAGAGAVGAGMSSLLH